MRTWTPPGASMPPAAACEEASVAVSAILARVLPLLDSRTAGEVSAAAHGLLAGLERHAVGAIDNAHAHGHRLEALASKLDQFNVSFLVASGWPPRRARAVVRGCAQVLREVQVCRYRLGLGREFHPACMRQELDRWGPGE